MGPQSHTSGRTLRYGRGGYSQSEPEVAPEATETYRVYWQVQYDRVAQHENGCYQVSAYVSAGSLVALGFITRLVADSWLLWIATLGVALRNILATIFVAGERRLGHGAPGAS